MRMFFRFLFHFLCLIGRPFGGIRPRRIYDIVGRRAYPAPEFTWRRNRWGSELFLSPSYHIDRNIIAFGCYDPDLHRTLERLVQPGMTCLDVGANLGEMALHMALKTGTSGRVYAFEPAPAAFERLQKHIQRNSAEQIVRAFPLALSNRKGTATISCPAPEQDNQGLGSLVNRDAQLAPLKFEIATATLDDFATGQKLDRIGLIKVDIQGAEFDFFQGAARVLEEHSPDVLVEISPDDLKHSGKSSRDLCQLIESYGYAIYRLNGSEIGSRIVAVDVSADFYAVNVYCTKVAPGILK